MTAPLLSKVPVAETPAPLAPEALLCRLEDCWDEDVPCEHTLSAAREVLQGAWFSVSGRREAELLVSGNRFTVRFADGHIYMGVFDLNPLGQPATMDMHVEEGPTRHKGQTALCIYVLDGDVLRWCATDPGRTERLAGFPEESDPNYLCLQFRRGRPV